MSVGDILESTNNKSKISSDFVFSFKGKLPAFIISDINNSASTAAARRVIKSIADTNSKLMPFIIPATTPATIDNDLKDFNKSRSVWTYPLPNQKRIDLATGLHLTGYNAKDVDKVIACAVSHMRCWLLCASQRFPIVVLEHDALFVRKVDFFKDIVGSLEGYYSEILDLGIVGLNNPRGATRKSSIYFDHVTKFQGEVARKVFDGYAIVDAPWVDKDRYTPQGIAGNSAYMITPAMAMRLLKKVDEIGLWPNDALMCKQLFPNQLKQIYPFVTELQGIKSTTTG